VTKNCHATLNTSSYFDSLSVMLSDSTHKNDISNEIFLTSLFDIHSVDSLNHSLIKVVTNKEGEFLVKKFSNFLIALPLDIEKKSFHEGFYIFNYDLSFHFLYFQLNCRINWSGNYSYDRNLKSITSQGKDSKPYSRMLLNKGQISYLIIFNLNSDEKKVLSETIYIDIEQCNLDNSSVGKVMNSLIHAQGMMKLASFTSQSNYILETSIHLIPSNYFDYNYTWTRE